MTATLAWYLAAGWAVQRGIAPPWRAIVGGTLPVLWLSIVSAAGCCETLTGLSSRWTLLLVLAATVVIAGRRALPATDRPRAATWAPLEAFASTCAVVLGVVVLGYGRLVEPWGGWDAQFTWVLRAKFLFQGGELWRNAFSPDLALLHPDYPPLLGWALAALWRLDGEPTPAAVGCLMLPPVVGYVLIVIGWARTSHRRDGWRPLCIATLLTVPLLWKLAAGSLADFLLAYGLFASTAWYSVAVAEASPHKIAAAGGLIAWCGLVKNEGVLWLVACTATVALSAVWARHLRATRARPQLLRPLLLGAALPALALVVFKLCLAPPSDLVDPRRTFEIGEVIQPGVLVNPAPLIVRVDGIASEARHRLILTFLGSALSDFRDWGPATLLILVLLVLRRFHVANPLWYALLLQVAGYYVVYLITPYHLYWHLSTSLSRILVHVLPAAVALLAFDVEPSLLLGPMTEPSATGSRPGRLVGAAILVGMSGFNAWSCLRGDWHLGEAPPGVALPPLDPAFPVLPSASFVSDQLGDRAFYAAQFAAAPTVLVVDRREATLLASFRSEADLLRYCERHAWRLAAHTGGEGWARDAGGRGLVQPRTVPRID